jgi:putative membrane protein
LPAKHPLKAAALRNPACTNKDILQYGFKELRMNQRSIRVLVCILALGMAASQAYSQNAPTNPPRSTTPQTPGPGTRATPAPATAGQSNAFLDQAIEINIAEIQLGRLAAAKAQNQRVKDYANMLVKDHSQALGKLQHLQGGKPAGQNTDVPLSAEHEKLRTRLAGLSGAQFDREYIDAMATGHREVVGLYEKQISSNTDKGSAELNKLVRGMLPTTKSHLQHAEQIQKTLAAPAK